MYKIQWRTLEEGFGALWSDFPNGGLYESRSNAAIALRAIRADYDPEYLNQYRIVEIDSPEYYSQPTDILEY